MAFSVYVPGTEETDPKKIIQSLRAIAEVLGGLSGTVLSVGTAGLATGGPITATGTVTVPAAVQADLETPNSTTLAVTPAVIKNHPGVDKAWCYVTVAAGVYTLVASHNVASISKVGTGNITITFTVPFSSAVFKASAVSDARGFAATAFPVSASTATVRVTDFSITDSDRGFSFDASGDQ